MRRGESTRPELDDAIRALYAQGIRGGRLAARLGLSKNVVAGRCYRLGLTPRETRAKPAAPTLVVRAATARPAGCSFVAGDPADLRRGVDPFCGEKREPGHDYCALHVRAMRVPRAEKARAA